MNQIRRVDNVEIMAREHESGKQIIYVVREDRTIQHIPNVWTAL